MPSLALVEGRQALAICEACRPLPTLGEVHNPPPNLGSEGLRPSGTASECSRVAALDHWLLRVASLVRGP